MRYPVNKVYITQEWGANPEIYKRFGLKGHNGLDLRMFDENGNRASTCNVYSPHSGTVLEALNDTNGYGLYLKIENTKYGSILAHNKKLLVKEGDKVKEGQLVAIGDNTGWSTGAHVHWGLYPKPRDRGNGYSGTINPIPIINKDNMSDTYKGLDLTNKESMKAAVDVWADVKDGLYIKKEYLDEKIKDATEDLTQDLKKCELRRSELGKVIKEARESIAILEEELRSEKASKAQYKGQVERLKEELEECQTKDESTDIDWKRWIRNTLIFSAPVLITQLGSLYNEVPKDTALGVLGLFAINVIIDLLRKFIKAEQATKRLKKSDE